MTFIPMKQNVKKVFTEQQEEHLMVYAIKIAKMFYGLHMTDFRKLAYTYAVACESEAVPENWENEQCASRDWYYAFMNRHPRLTLKAPEGATTPGPSSATTPSPSSGTSPGPSAHLDVTPEGIRPFPKAPERPAGKGRKKVRACILTEDEESLSNLRAKEERKRKKDEKQGETKRRQKEQRVPIVPDNSDEEEELVMHLDDSSEYSDEVEEEDVTAPTPFQQKEPEEGDFILVELELEEGRNVGAKVHYVGKVLSVDDSGEYNVSFLRMSGKFGLNDTFYFPIIQDEMEVKKEQILGVLFEPSIQPQLVLFSSPLFL